MGFNIGNIGQGGSAHIKTAEMIEAPHGMVITAIHFIADNTPTLLVAEDNTKWINTVQASHNGVLSTALNMAGNLSGTKAIFDSLSGVEVGDVLIANETGATVVTVTELDPDGDNANECNLSSSVSMNDDAVVHFKRPKVGNEGCGGQVVSSLDFKAGSTIYGRWTRLVPEAAALIVYFGE